jgi:hypothetical protein
MSTEGTISLEKLMTKQEELMVKLEHLRGNMTKEMDDITNEINYINDQIQLQLPPPTLNKDVPTTTISSLNTSVDLKLINFLNKYIDPDPTNYGVKCSIFTKMINDIYDTNFSIQVIGRSLKKLSGKYSFISKVVRCDATYYIGFAIKTEYYDFLKNKNKKVVLLINK